MLTLAGGGTVRRSLNQSRGEVEWRTTNAAAGMFEAFSDPTVRKEKSAKPCNRSCGTSVAVRQPMKLSDLVGLVNQMASSTENQTIDVNSIDVELLDAPGRIVFVTKEPIRSLTPVQGTLPQ